MNSPQSQEVVIRFYSALQKLIDAGEIKNRNAFCKKYGIIQGHFWRAEHNPGSKIFEIGWLTYLVSDYGVSANWLMTGLMELKLSPDNVRKYAQLPKEEGADNEHIYSVVQVLCGNKTEKP